MRQILMAAALILPLGACTYVDNPGYSQAGYTQPGYVQGGYAQGGYAQGGYAQGGYVQAPSAYPPGSYEAEREAYEYGRRDGAATARGYR